MAETKVPISVTVSAEDIADLLEVIEAGSGVFPTGRALFLVWLCEQMRDDVKFVTKARPNCEGMHTLAVLRPFTFYYHAPAREFDGYENHVTSTTEWAETPMIAAALIRDRYQELGRDLVFYSESEIEQARRSR